MKTKSLIVFTLIALSLLLSACGSGALTSPSNLPAQSDPYVPTLSVAGSGDAFLTPDIAYIYIGVHTESPTAADAVAENNEQTEALIQALTEFGIDGKDIRTTNFSIWPMDQFDPATGRPTGEKSYAVDNTVYVTVRELDRLGDLLDTAVQAGANTVNSVQFDVAEKDEALKQARADAVKDAQAQAESLAQAAGLTLGEIRSISFIEAQPYSMFDRGGGGGAAAEAAAVPIQPGQLTFTVTVNVTYALR